MLLNEIILTKPIFEEVQREKLPETVLCRVTYPTCNIGKRNANKRVYEKAVWDKVLSEKDLEDKLEKRALFGHAEHPEQTQSNLEKVSHVVHKMWIDEKRNELRQTFDLFDTPTGRIVDVILRADCQVGVSTRAEGDLEEAEDDEGTYQRVIPESYKYVTTDFTADPSTFGAVPQDVKRNIVSTVGKELSNEKADKSEKEFARLLLESMQCKEKDKCQNCGCCKALAGQVAKTEKQYIAEGCWSYPYTEEKAKKLAGLLEKSLSAKEAKESLYSLMGDDTLFDSLDKAEESKASDVRSEVKASIKQMLEMYHKNPGGFKYGFEPKALEILHSIVEKGEPKMKKENEKTVKDLITDSTIKVGTKIKYGDQDAEVKEIKENAVTIAYDNGAGKHVDVQIQGSAMVEVHPEGTVTIAPQIETALVPLPSQEEIDQMAAAGPLPIKGEIPEEDEMGVEERIISQNKTVAIYPAGVGNNWDIFLERGPYRSVYLASAESKDEAIVQGKKVANALGLKFVGEKSAEDTKDTVSESEEAKFDESESAIVGRIKAQNLPILKGEKKSPNVISPKTYDFWIVGSSWEGGFDLPKDTEFRNTFSLFPNGKIVKNSFVEGSKEELEETKGIAKLYQDAGLPAPKGKGIHTRAFHELAVNVAKGYVKGSKNKSPMSPKKALELAYPTAMKQLGKEKAVKKAHRSNESIEVNEHLKDYDVQHLQYIIDHYLSPKEQDDLRSLRNKIDSAKTLIQDLIRISASEGSKESISSAAKEVKEGRFKVVLQQKDTQEKKEVEISGLSKELVRRKAEADYGIKDWQITDIQEIEEKKTISTTTKEITDLKVKEASTRAERDKALELLEELTSENQVTNKDKALEAKMLVSRIRKILEAKEQEVDALRSKLEEKAKLASELKEKGTGLKGELDRVKINLVTDIRGLEGVAKATEEKHTDEIKQLESKRVEEVNQLIEKYNKDVEQLKSEFSTKISEGIEKVRKEVISDFVKRFVALRLTESELKVDDNSRALLENCKSLEDVDDTFDEILDASRRGALHSNLLESIEIRRPVADPEQVEAERQVNNVFEGMGFIKKG